MIEELNRVRIGPFTTGEIPPLLEITFTDEDGTAISLNGCTAKFVITCVTEEGMANLGEGNSDIPDPSSSGKTTYTWDTNDMSRAGFYRGQMWVGDGQDGRRYASDLYEWWVEDATPKPNGV